MRPAGKTFVALFSGINVGGNRIVKMAELRAFLAEVGCRDVATYVQSGNAVFRADNGDATAISALLEAEFEKRWGFASRIMVRDAAWLERAVAENPYPEVAGEHARLHAFALERAPTADEAARLAERCAGPERFAIRGDVLYLHAPEGLGRSKFAGVIPRTLKIPGTARNWRTVLALLEMVKG